MSSGILPSFRPLYGPLPSYALLGSGGIIDTWSENGVGFCIHFLQCLGFSEIPTEQAYCCASTNG